MVVDLNSIRAEMARNNMTIKSLAKQMNLSAGGLGRKLKGYRSFTADEIYLISKIFNKDISVFFN